MADIAEQTQTQNQASSGGVFDSVEDKLDAAQLYHRAGNLPQAEEMYREILRDHPEHPEAYHLMGLIALQVGQPSVAKEFIQVAISLDGENAKYQANLGAVHFNLQEFEEAEAAYREATELDPEYGEAFLNLGILLKEQGNTDEAIDPLDRACNLRQRDPKPFALLAEILISKDHYEAADKLARAANKLGDGDSQTMAAKTRALTGLGRPREALPVARRLVNLEPTNSKFHLHLANACLDSGNTTEAITSARRAVYLTPEWPQAYLTYSQTLIANTRWDEALQAIDDAMVRFPENEDLMAQKAGVLERKGRFKEAYELVRPLIKDRQTYKFNALSTFITLARRYGAEREAVGLLELFRQKKGLPNGARCTVNFQAGEMYHALGEYDTAFEAYQTANQLKPRTYYPENSERFFQRLKEQYTRGFLEQGPRSGLATSRPVFIVGMPRSGTSLLEQILASHPRVFGAGELDTVGSITRTLPRRIGSQSWYPECMSEVSPNVLHQAGEEYLGRLDELDPEGSDRVTDKMPQNFLHLGLLALMFPNATFIHIRRDPMDTCLSCYFQNFVAQGLTFAYNLEHLGHYYRQYQDLMAHWREVLPVRLLEVDYEHIVEEPEGQIASLLEFCGLAWDDACLEFHKTKRDVRTASYDQVRKPLYTSSKKKWKKYEKHLDPLKQALGLEEA
jgi:tetratricopeptide (TPR) repeat protein